MRPFVRGAALALVAIVSLASASVADAQIYSWRDASGSLVLSDQAPTTPVAGVRKFRVPHASNDVLATKPTSAAYRETYDKLIVQHAEKQGLRPDLVRAVVQVESGYNARAVSSAGAQGLMQLMPATAASMGVKNSFQPQQNVSGGSEYLDELLTRYGNNLAMALAAYNAGPEAVDRYHGIPPYPETHAYVARVIHEFNRRIRARKAAERSASANRALPPKLHSAVSQR